MPCFTTPPAISLINWLIPAERFSLSLTSLLQGQLQSRIMYSMVLWRRTLEQCEYFSAINCWPVWPSSVSPMSFISLHSPCRIICSYQTNALKFWLMVTSDFFLQNHSSCTSKRHASAKVRYGLCLHSDTAAQRCHGWHFPGTHVPAGHRLWTHHRPQHWHHLHYWLVNTVILPTWRQRDKNTYLSSLLSQHFIKRP